ncbi:MAG: AGE family epimerase/isomerase [Hymenobacter sp.]
MLQAAEFQAELVNILTYWRTYAPDEVEGGFLGKIDNDNRPGPTAPKGAVLHARILWTFAAACNHQPSAENLAVARRAYEYVTAYFLDAEHGGVYWSVDYQGRPLDTKKQIYALAFTIYGLSEYYRASGDAQALAHAQALFRTIEAHSFDPAAGVPRSFCPRLAAPRRPAPECQGCQREEDHEHAPPYSGGVCQSLPRVARRAATPANQGVARGFYNPPH